MIRSGKPSPLTSASSSSSGAVSMLDGFPSGVVAGLVNEALNSPPNPIEAPYSSADESSPPVAADPEPAGLACELDALVFCAVFESPVEFAEISSGEAEKPIQAL